MRGRTTNVGSGAELDELVADLISRGYWLTYRTATRATMVRPRRARFLTVLMVLCGGLAVLLFLVGLAGGGTGQELLGLMVSCLLLAIPIGLVRTLYLSVRGDQVVHVVCRDAGTDGGAG